MKLKRILSLALSGVLAVSMLTGCGGIGSSINKFLDNRTSTVCSALNSAQGMMSYRKGGKDLDDAISKVAGTLVPGQVTDGVADRSVNTTVRQLTGYGDMSLTPWAAQTTEGEETYVKVFVYNVDDEAYDSTEEVAAEIANKLSVMNLKSETATVSGEFTNSYKGNVVAYEKTVGEGDSAFDALVVGVSITQTVAAKN